MNAIWIIALREWRSMFLSPLAWTLLAVLFAISSYMFVGAMLNYRMALAQYGMYGVTQLPLTDFTMVPLLSNLAVLLLLVLPLLTMRLIADEKHRGSWPALASSAVTPSQIIWGKFLSVLLFLLLLLALITLLPVTLLAYGQLDGGQVVGGMLGLFLLAAAFSAVGLAASTTTEQPIIAALISFGFLLLLWIVGWVDRGDGSTLSQVVGYLSMLDHFKNFLDGSLQLSDIGYFLLLTLLGLSYADIRLRRERIQG
uniref:ABC-2 type transporter transmembrane domain-containing protein n=1 Tax=Magnetococcus massalia (strain MO-1) TaxID=451514 RepID=A0A1S7LD42_MAGMO|nr:Conserved protein of unknown function. ABC transporter, permease protein [Candidatus Magnetococcus massalia]